MNVDVTAAEFNEAMRGAYTWWPADHIDSAEVGHGKAHIVVRVNVGKPRPFPPRYRMTDAGPSRADQEAIEAEWQWMRSTNPQLPPCEVVVDNGGAMWTLTKDGTLLAFTVWLGQSDQPGVSRG